MSPNPHYVSPHPGPLKPEHHGIPFPPDSACLAPVFSAQRSAPDVLVQSRLRCCRTRTFETTLCRSRWRYMQRISARRSCLYFWYNSPNVRWESIHARVFYGEMATFHPTSICQRHGGGSPCSTHPVAGVDHSEGRRRMFSHVYCQVSLALA